MPVLDLIAFKPTNQSEPQFWERNHPYNDFAWTEVPQALTLLFLDYAAWRERGRSGKFSFVGRYRKSLAASLGDAIFKNDDRIHELFSVPRPTGGFVSEVKAIFVKGDNIHGKSRDRRDRRIAIGRDSLPPDCIEVFWDYDNSGTARPVTEADEFENLAETIRQAIGLTAKEQPLFQTDAPKAKLSVAVRPRTRVPETEFVDKAEVQFAPSRLFRGRNTPSRHLFGRDEERRALDAAWSGPKKKNIVTIVAWGGVGKTSLVSRWAADTLAKKGHGGIERYFDWSFYSQGTRREGDATGSAKAASADLFLKEALEFFGDHALAASNASAWEKGERLAQLIARQRTLVILDGLEPLQAVKSGELSDEGLGALLRGLAAHNRGLCLVTTRQHLPEVATWHQTTAPEWKLARLTDEAGAALLTQLGVNGTFSEKGTLSARLRGHALSLALLGRYLKCAHLGDIRRVDQVDFQKVNEKEQAGHAFRVIAAYERWFRENNCRAELAILRMLGLFDRPATPDCLTALRSPPIPGLTDVFASLNEDAWNEAVTRLVELDLVEEQCWEPRRVLGYGEDIARKAMEASLQNCAFPLGEPTFLEARHSLFGARNSLDSHPLIREFFAKQLQETAADIWKTAHARLFDHLRTSVPYWPEGFDGLQPLYQAVGHGCEAGMQQQTCDLYFERISRGDDHYSWTKLGSFGTDLAATSSFFVHLWSRPSPLLTQNDQAWLLNEVAFCLRALGRLDQAMEPMQAGLHGAIRNGEMKEAALRASNVSELELSLGNVLSAVEHAGQCVSLAGRSGDAYWKMASQASVGDALHQAGRFAEALSRFRVAEGLQGEREPHFPILHGWWGFLYCDLLVAASERIAWRRFMSANKRSQMSSRLALNERSTEVTKDYRPAANVLESLRSVYERPAKIFEWRKLPNWNTAQDSVLAVALDHLTQGRAVLYRAILSDRSSDLSSAVAHVSAAENALRRAGQRDDLPRGLVTRAWLRSVQGQPDLARADLDEAWQIAERGPMRLHLADIHLHRARLFNDKGEVQHARDLIERCGYWRRKQELEDAEEAAKEW